jgi:hypothetical protein
LKRIALLLVGLLFATGLPLASAAAEYSAEQKTLASFSGSVTTLTTKQKEQVFAAIKANPNAEKFICTGIRYYDQSMSVNITVRKRAKAACEYALKLNPNLSTWFQNKPTQARSYAGKVLLTIKSPKGVAETPSARGIEDRPDAVAGFQIKPIYLKPSDAVDTQVDTNGTITASLVEGQDMLQAKLGLAFEVDRRSDGVFDIGFIDSPLTKAQIKDIVGNGGNLSRLLQGTPFQRPTENRKIYSIFVELPSVNDFCGIGQLSGSISVTLMQGNCAGPSHGLRESYSETWVHEAFHNLGVAHVPDRCDLMSSTYDFPGNPCYSNEETFIDPEKRYYRGASAAGPDITLMNVWRSNNRLSASGNASCDWTYVNSVAQKDLVVCSIGQAMIGPRDFCWSSISSSTLQELKAGSWVNVGKGTASKLPWRTKKMWSCDDPSSVAPSLIIGVPVGIERDFRWIVNGRTLDPFTVVFQN